MSEFKTTTNNLLTPSVSKITIANNNIDVNATTLTKIVDKIYILGGFIHVKAEITDASNIFSFPVDLKPNSTALLMNNLGAFGANLLRTRAKYLSLSNVNIPAGFYYVIGTVTLI